MLKIIRRSFLAIALLGTSTLNAQGDEIASKQVEIITSYGTMVVLLYDKTPEHRDNFLKLVDSGFYNGLLFHRVINNFMVQGGDPDSKGAAEGAKLGQGGPGYTVPAEIYSGYYHKKGALAAARQGDQANPEKRSSGSQFYIVDGKTYSKADLDRLEQRKHMLYYKAKMNAYLADTSNKVDLDRFVALSTAKNTDGMSDFNHELEEKIDLQEGTQPNFSYSEDQINTYSFEGGTPHLDGDYTVFGEVISGYELIDQLASVETDAAGRPLVDIKMTLRVIN